MTKTQLVAALADEMGSDKKSASAALDAVCNIITREFILSRYQACPEVPINKQWQLI
jgi:nucleoid DNA-binding protein